MYKFTNLCQKKKSPGLSSSKRLIKVNNDEVKKIMGKYYSAYVLSINDIYKSLG